ncbi:MAG TPA: universal stress protein [Candidatus Binatia bacterium]|nr:universal stress protein [Candidatus Binatia bacterium]
MIRTVLCPVDFSPISARELHLAAQLCRRFQARLVVQHSIAGEVPPLLGVSWMHAEEHRTEEQATGADSRNRLRDLLASIPRTVKAEGILTRGQLDRTLLDLAAALPADLIVIGTHGRSGIEHRSLTDRVILDAPCPVLTTRDESSDEAFPRIDNADPDTIRTLVPMDFSPHSRLALDYAVALLKWLPLELHVLHVDLFGNEDEGETLELLRNQVPAELRDRIVIQMRRGSVSREVLRGETELQARLIVMGTHHKAWLRRLFSDSTARTLLHASFCPVWFVPEVVSVHPTEA